MSPKRKVVRHVRPVPGLVTASRTATAATAGSAFGRRRRRRGVAIGLFVLAPIIAVSHILEHLGAFHVMTPAAEDIFVGWPIAVLLLVIGGILWG